MVGYLRIARTGVSQPPSASASAPSGGSAVSARANSEPRSTTFLSNAWNHPQSCRRAKAPGSQEFSALRLSVEAVISELVSARLFPVLRENTAKFADFRPRDDNSPRLCIGNSIAYHRNSLNTKTGKPFA